MNHKIVSFYHKHLNPEITNLQKKIFSKLEIDLIQYEFEGTHGSAINDFLKNNDWDLITLFDVDCIPLNKNVIDNVRPLIDDNTIYGNAQISNSFPYAAPSFVSFNRKTYEDCPHKNFEGMFYPNEHGSHVEADCGEVFVKECLRIGKKQILSYPKSVIEKKWYYPGNDSYPSFEYGNGTFFDNDTFHCFQIRIPNAQSIFINFVNNFLNEKS
jgi:hypothetical protein